MEHVQNYSFNIKCETIKWLKLLYPCGRWGYVEIVHKGNVIDISSYSTKYNKWLVNSAPCLPLSQLNTYKGHCSGWMNQKVDSLCRIGSRHERISSRISECLKTKTIEQDVDKTPGPGGWRRPRPGKWKIFIYFSALKIFLVQTNLTAAGPRAGRGAGAPGHVGQAVGGGGRGGGAGARRVPPRLLRGGRLPPARPHQEVQTQAARMKFYNHRETPTDIITRRAF